MLALTVSWVPRNPRLAVFVAISVPNPEHWQRYWRMIVEDSRGQYSYHCIFINVSVHPPYASKSALATGAVCFLSAPPMAYQSEIFSITESWYQYIISLTFDSVLFCTEWRSCALLFLQRSGDRWHCLDRQVWQYGTIWILWDSH